MQTRVAPVLESTVAGRHPLTKDTTNPAAVPAKAAPRAGKTLMLEDNQHLEALCSRLDLPAEAVRAGALQFVINDDTPVVALIDLPERLLLLAELGHVGCLCEADWRLLGECLAERFEDREMGRLVILHGRLAFGWSYRINMKPARWAARVEEALAWAVQLRAQWLASGAMQAAPGLDAAA